MSTLTTATPAFLYAASKGDNIKTRTARLLSHFALGGDPRDPPRFWRASYHGDDPTNEPDLWIADQSRDEVIWCKLDSHPNEAPGLPCTWCGQAHADVMNVYTYMLPSDY